MDARLVHFLMRSNRNHVTRKDVQAGLDVKTQALGRHAICGGYLSHRLATTPTRGGHRSRSQPENVRVGLSTASGFRSVSSTCTGCLSG
jgi:hypothetical protein